MTDNPIGVAAWILEKFHGWSDLRKKSLIEVYGYDDLITNLMLYILTNSFNTASWIYYGRREEGGRVINFDGGKVEVPTACALYPKELSLKEDTLIISLAPIWLFVPFLKDYISKINQKKIQIFFT